MTCTTYLYEFEYTQDTSNNTVNSVLKDLNKESGNKWRVRECLVTSKKNLFSKPVTKKFYELYYHLNHSEFQIINFYCEKSSSSINFMVSADVLIAYMHGVIGGIWTKRKVNDV